MKIVLIISLILFSHNIVARAGELYSVSSKEMGITSFDYTVSEFERGPNYSKIIIENFSNRSAAASRWMMCAFTDLTIKRGFGIWAVYYPDKIKDELLVVFPSTESQNDAIFNEMNLEASKALTGSVETFAVMCGMRPLVSSTPRSDVPNEIVLSNSETISVKSNWGDIEIAYISKYKRKYTWDGQSTVVDLIPRDERWYGSLGLYHPQVRPPHKGVVHMVVEEGQQHFETIDDALIWLKMHGRKPIYNDDGLVITVDFKGENSDKIFVGIDLWQIYVGGKILSEYQEAGATEKSLESEKKYLSEKVFENRSKIYLRKHYLGGHKPNKLPGSQNSRIILKST